MCSSSFCSGARYGQERRLRLPRFGPPRPLWARSINSALPNDGDTPARPPHVASSCALHSVQPLHYSSSRPTIADEYSSPATAPGLDFCGVGPKRPIWNPSTIPGWSAECVCGFGRRMCRLDSSGRGKPKPNRERRWLIVRILGRTAELSRSIQMSSCVTPRTWLGPRSSRSRRSRKKKFCRRGRAIRSVG